MTTLEFIPTKKYVVKRGQTVFAIAKMHAVPPAMLIKTNALTSLEAGRILTIPEFCGELYTVEAGDSAESLGLSARELEENGIKGIYPGLVIARRGKA